MKRFLWIILVVLMVNFMLFNNVYAFSLFGDSDIDLVKKSSLNYDRSISLGDLFDSYPYFKNKKWEQIKDNRNRNIVQFSADIDIEYTVINDIRQPVVTSNMNKKTKIGNSEFTFKSWILDNEKNINVQYIAQFYLSTDKKSFDIGFTGFVYNDKEFNKNHNEIEEIYAGNGFGLFLLTLFRNDYLKFLDNMKKEASNNKKQQVIEELDKEFPNFVNFINGKITLSSNAYGAANTLYIIKFNNITFDEINMQVSSYTGESKNKYTDSTQTYIYSETKNWILKGNGIRYFTDNKGNLQGKMIYSREGNEREGLLIDPTKKVNGIWLKGMIDSHGGFLLSDLHLVDIEKNQNNITTKTYARVNNEREVLVILQGTQNDPILSKSITESNDKTQATTQNQSLVMTDELYDKFTEDSRFCLSEMVLNKTWNLIKSSMNKKKYQEILSQQKEWVNSGRNDAANEYASHMSPVEAFTKANIDRANELALILNPQIEEGEYVYSDGEGSMNIKLINDNDYSLEIITTAGQNICEASGNFSYSNNGWIKVDDTPDMIDDDLYILFLEDGAIVLPQNSSFLCGLNATIEGRYDLLE